jgi:hypothetical protein
MENFITGYTGHEHQLREAMLDVLGKDKYEFFFDKVSDSRSNSLDHPVPVMRAAHDKSDIHVICPVHVAEEPLTHPTVPHLLLWRGRCQALRFAWPQLPPPTSQLPPL